jgi:hypothetical protein
LPHCFDMGMGQKSIRAWVDTAFEGFCFRNCLLVHFDHPTSKPIAYWTILCKTINFTGGSRLTGVNIDASHYIDRCQKMRLDWRQMGIQCRLIMPPYTAGKLCRQGLLNRIYVCI